MQFPDQCSISDYLNKSFTCNCGKKHFVPIKYINIFENALLTLPEIIKENSLHKSFLIFDSTTYSITGSQIIQLMTEASLPFTSFILKNDEPVPDEKTLGEVLINFDISCDTIIAIGSGTINDLSRFISYKMKLPYIIIATAPSVDGYASNVAPFIINNMKTTLEAQTPLAIIGDINLLKNAPMKMIAAGIGDILGKYTCLCEWNIAHIINGEYYCSNIEKLVRQSLETVVSNITEAGQRNPVAIKNIMEALVLSGIAMSFAGNSRPASGSEHHLSHYWEMMYLFQGRKPILHGAKVGIGTIAVLKAYELLMQQNINFDQAIASAGNYSREKWEDKMKSAYHEAADSVIKLEQEIGKNEAANVVSRIKRFESNLDRIKSIAGQLPTADSIRDMLISLGAPYSPVLIGLDKNTFIDSFIVAKELRNRYGLLQILFDLGLTEEIAELVWEYISKIDFPQH